MKWLAGLFAPVILGLGVLLGLTGFTKFEPAAKAATDQGVARVAGCTRSGPVSIHGFGYWWTCQADVAWESGRRTRVTA